MNKITPFLWFNNQAEEAMHFYASLFKHSEVTEIRRSGNGDVTGGTVVLDGQVFHTLNGGPHYQFTPAFSMFVSCDTQDEVDALWRGLVAGGKPSRCGWLTDRYGLSWQLVPRVLSDLLVSPDPGIAGRVMQAMLQMSKIDIAQLQHAAAAAPAG